jgi:hypothetical protein
VMAVTCNTTHELKRIEKPKIIARSDTKARYEVP